MNMTKRIISALLVLAMGVSMAACAEKADETVIPEVTVSDETVPEDVDLDPLEARKLVSDDLPAMDFEGRSLRILTVNYYLWDVWEEELTGDIVEDAVLERNKAMLDRFNFNIPEPVSPGDYDKVSSVIRQSVASADDEYDLVFQHMIQAGIDALTKIFLNWYEVDYVNFEKPWYSKFAIEGLSLNNRMYTCFSDMQLAGIDRTYCMIYDKNVAADNNLDSITEMSANGEWTIGALNDICSVMYTDLNGDGKANADDYYGFTSPISNNTSPYFYSFNIPRLDIDEDGNVTLAINCEKMSDTVNLLRTLFDKNNTWSGSDAGNTYFRNGHALVYSACLGDTLGDLRDYEHDYGIIPYPKFDEQQENYYTIMGGGVTTLCMPLTLTDTDFVGFVVEAMSAETWKNVVPKYYDIALKVKGARDEESIAVMDQLLAGRAVDISIAYDAWNGFTYKLPELINGGKDWASYFKSKEKGVQRHYEKVVKLFFED